MSERTSIKEALVAAMNSELNSSNEGSHYYTNIDNAVSGENLFLDSIETFPAISISLGPERPEYHPSGFRWSYLTLYIRGFVKSEDASEDQLEQLISDIKTFIDNFERLEYTVTKPDGSQDIKTITQMNMLSLTTDEGVLKPLGLSELSLEVKYVDRNVRR